MAGSKEASDHWHAVEPAVAAWYRRARESQFAHYAAAEHYSALARWLGVPSVLLSAAVGTTLFATLQEESTPSGLRFATGIVAIAAGALTALQTFLSYGDRAEKHRTAASAYGSIRRQIEQYQVLPLQSEPNLRSMMEVLRRRLDDVSTAAPDVPPRIWDRAQKNIKDTSRPEGFRHPKASG